MMNGMGGHKMPPTMKLPKLCTIWSYAIEDLRSIAREVDISFGSVQAILIDVYGMSKVSTRWVPIKLVDWRPETDQA
jgi:hypothetical protein